MTVQEIVEALQLEVLTGEGNFDNMVSGGYASDLLSNVMGEAALGNVWVTMQNHQNIIAVAALLGLSAVIIVGNIPVDRSVIEKAAEQEVVLLHSSLSVFEIVGRLYGLGIKGL